MAHIMNRARDGVRLTYRRVRNHRSPSVAMIIEVDPEGGYISYFDGLPGVMSQGETVDEARDNLFDALESTFDAIMAEKMENAAPGYMPERMRLCLTA